MSIISIIGYHATEEENEASIKEHNFWPSTSAKEWLGKGAYFFVEGETLPDAVQNAKSWASYKRFNRYIVLEATIEVEEEVYLDLTQKKGREVFAFLKKEYLSFIANKGRVKYSDSKNKVYIDGYVIGHAPKVLSYRLKVIKNEVCIRFSQDLNLNIASGVPNATIVSVINPENTIDLSSISVVFRSRQEKHTSRF